MSFNGRELILWPCLRNRRRDEGCENGNSLLQRCSPLADFIASRATLLNTSINPFADDDLSKPGQGPPFRDTRRPTFRERCSLIWRPFYAAIWRGKLAATVSNCTASR